MLVEVAVNDCGEIVEDASQTFVVSVSAHRSRLDGMGTCGDEEEQGKEGKPARDESLWRKSSAAVRIHFTWRSNDRRSTHRAADRRSE